MAVPRIGAFAAPLALALGLAASATAMPEPEPAAPREPPGTPTSPEGSPLEQRYQRLEKSAQALADAYRKAIAERIDQLAQANSTLARLREVGLFTPEAILSGVSDEPFLAVQQLRENLSRIEETAMQLAREFGGVAKERNEQAAIRFLRRVAECQTTFRETDKDGNGILDFADNFAGLTLVGLAIPTGEKGKLEIKVDGYKFRVLFADTLHWAADGAPEKPGETGDRFFYIDQSGIVRAERGKGATPTSPPVQD